MPVNITKRADGRWWPESDRHCYRVLPREVKGLDETLRHVTDFSVAVQAGGNVGIWPARLCVIFDSVHTFEPDAENFACMERNLADFDNVYRYRKALGDLDTRCEVDRGNEANCGAYQLQYGIGDIDVVSVDSLSLYKCGLLQLDVEGAELEALRGAADTIERCRPVVSVEIKGLGERYGASDDDVIEFLAERGYRHVASPCRDMIFVP